MDITPQEQRALRQWMDEKGLSMSRASDLIDVTGSTVFRWLKGEGGIRPAQRVKLLEHIRPYLPPREEARQVLKELTGQDVGPGGSGLGHGLNVLKLVGKESPIEEIQRRLAEVERRLGIAPKPFEEVAEERGHYGQDLRTYREHEAPLRLAAGGGIPQAPTTSRTAIIDGDSMEPSYRHGQEVIISHFAEPLTLGAAGYIDFAYIKQRLKSGGHYWLQLNEGGLTVKGLELEPPNERGVWRLILVAENPHWGEEFGYRQGRRALHFGETLQIYGTVKK